MLGFFGGGASHAADSSDQSDDDDLSDAVDGVSPPTSTNWMYMSASVAQLVRASPSK